MLKAPVRSGPVGLTSATIAASGSTLIYMKSAAQYANPLVSIIVTSHNYDAYLAGSIRSALEQTWPNIEVIVVDDGSTDDSAELIRSFGDSIRPVFKKQGGQCAAANAGFELSKGEFIIFLDADDILLPDAAALHAAELTVSGTTKSCGYMTPINEEGATWSKRIPNHLPKSGNYRDVTIKYGLDTFHTSFTSAHAWSRAFLERVMPLPEQGPIGLDGYLTAIDRLFGRIAFVQETVVQYRLHTRNKGPIRYRFDMAYMKNRLARKAYRQNYAELWIRQLGYTMDPVEFRTIRDWRLGLMQHVLWLNDQIPQTLPLREFITTPFRNKHRNILRSMGIAASLMAVRLLPKAQALRLSDRLLENSILGGRIAMAADA